MARTEAKFSNSDVRFEAGQSADFKVTVTDSLSSTVAIPVFGKYIGRIRNPSTNNLTLSFYDADSINSTEYLCYDKTNNSVEGFVLTAKSSRPFPEGLEGVNILVPLLTAGSTSIDLSFNIGR